MKRSKLATAAAVVSLTGFALTLALADNATNTPPAKHQGPHGEGQLLDHVLPPKIIASLALTADQQSTLDSLEAAYKKDATKWRADNPIDETALKQARDTSDKEALRQFREKQQGLQAIRKGYFDKFRAILTDAQKTTLEEMRSRKTGGQHGAKPAAPTPPPAE